MNPWAAYKNLIAGNLSIAKDRSATSLTEWRNLLFYRILVVMLPFCLIAVIPGIYLSIISNLPVLAFFDGLVFALIAIAALMPGIYIEYRKILFTISFYTIAVILLAYLGLYGPGILYLYAACVFAILIFPGRYAFWWSFINLGVCLVFAWMFHFNWIQSEFVESKDVSHWLIIASNLVFLSFVSSALIPRLFSGLEKTIESQKKISRELKENQKNLKSALNELEAKNKELEHFVNATSHDLQEPLRMVNSFLIQIEKKYGHAIDERGHKYIEFAKQGTGRMRQIILDLLEFSSIENESGNPELVDLKDLIAEILKYNQTVIIKKSAQISFPDQLPAIITYKTPLFLTLHNLINNSLKYQKPNTIPRIKIDFAEKDKIYLFSVEDNGIGIEKEYFEKIFIIFQRLHTHDVYNGTGIGLASAKKSVEKLLGKIWLQSTPGKGTIFFFEISKNLNKKKHETNSYTIGRR